MYNHAIHRQVPKEILSPYYKEAKERRLVNGVQDRATMFVAILYCSSFATAFYKKVCNYHSLSLGHQY
jgi:hypothetical protein